MIGPGGVVVIDTMQYRGRLRLDHYGLLWHGRHPLALTLHAVRPEADEVLGIAEVQVAAVVAVHGSSVPWGRVDTDGVTVIPHSAGIRLAAGAAAGAWARAGGLAGRPGPPSIPPRRLTRAARPPQRAGRPGSACGPWM